MTGKTAIFEVSLEIEKQLGMVKETTDELADQHETLEMSAKEYREQLRTIREIKKLETDQNRWAKSKIDLSLSQNDLSRRAEHEQKRRDNEHKSRLLDHLKVIKSIYGVTMSIGKTALFGSVGLAGAFWGINRLADSTKSDRSTAHQLNKGDIGGLKALENVYGGSIFSDAKSMLGEVKGIMRGDSGYSEMAKLGALLGKSFDKLSAMKPVDVLTDATIASKEFADNLRAAGQGFFVNNPAMTSGQLPSMFAEKLQDIDSYPLSELKEKREKVKEYQVKLNLDDKPAKGWEDFSTARDNTYDAMIKKLKEEVVGLTVPLTELEVSIEKAAVAFLGSELMGDAIEYTTEKLTEFSKYVSSDQAKKDWDELRKDAKEAGVMLHEFGVGMRKLGVKLGLFEETQQEKNLRELQESMPEDPFAKSDGTLWGDYKENFKEDEGVNGIKKLAGMTYDYVADKVSSAFNGGSKDINDKNLTFEDAPVVMAEFMKLGLKQHEAAGMAAQMWEESGFKTKSIGDKTIKGKVSNSYEQAEGGFQWRKERKTDFRNVIKKEIADSNRAEQIRFAYWELNNTEKPAGDLLRATKTARQAGKEAVKFERPQDVAGAESKRAAIAEKFNEMYPSYIQKKKDNAPMASRLFGSENSVITNLAIAYDKPEHAPTKERANELQVQIDKPEHAPTVDDKPSETKDWKSPILKKLTEDALKRKGYKQPEKHGESETTGGGGGGGGGENEPKIKDYAPPKKTNTIQIPQSRTPTMPYLTLNINNQTGGNVTTEALKY